MARTDRCFAERGIIYLRNDPRSGRGFADARGQLRELLLEVLFELVDDTRLLFRRKSPSGDDVSKAFAPFIHIGLR